MPDFITVQGIACYGYHGGTEEERKLGQRFVVDLDLELDLGSAGRADDLEQTVDYAEVITITRQIVEGPPVHLLETVAETVASQLLNQFPRLDGLRVRVHKPNTPVPDLPTGDVSVAISRRRDKSTPA